MTNPRHRVGAGSRRLLGLVLVAALLGCGGPKIYPVNGKVVYVDGSPVNDLTGYKVEFESIDGKIDGKGVSAEGEVRNDGTFQMTTLKPGDGALLGSHRVLVAPPAPEGDTPTRPHAIDPRYVSYETSGLKATVEARTNEVTLTLERRRLDRKKK